MRVFSESYVRFIQAVIESQHDLVQKNKAALENFINSFNNALVNTTDANMLHMYEHANSFIASFLLQETNVFPNTCDVFFLCLMINRQSALNFIKEEFIIAKKPHTLDGLYEFLAEVNNKLTLEDSIRITPNSCAAEINKENFKTEPKNVENEKKFPETTLARNRFSKFTSPKNLPIEETYGLAPVACMAKL